ncbi:hypothetical protein [Variovorax sp. OV329]|uniref:hypothetical protein n=1 Tax=Variovorax sp. OV329 TaxID=1882825 RepID=UPI0008ED078B|nr:hypothetical protein [Variovorax sp. OV329]SFL86843.1 hypothetical protein SAMN05444747_10147 [Variovorax sp. OV329]
MTKYCDACHTVNRDRALYCRGCAGRFGTVAPDARQRQIHPAAASLSMPPPPALPTPEPSATPQPRMSRSRMLLGVALPACASLTAALVIWQQWTLAGEVRSRPEREVAQQPAAGPVPTAATAATASASQAQATPALDATANESPVDPSAAAIPQESLLALTVEHNAKGAAYSPDGTTQRLLHPAPAQPPRNYAVVQRVPTETESDMSMSTAEPTDRPSTRRALPSRPVVADSRSQRRPGAKSETPARAVWTAQGSAIPCNRYNPFGDAVCATIPDPSRQARPRVYSQR